ncbi:mevalonate kinase family protein [Marinobacterium litorale]|uniref:mevalonate kinase family protein n=1 Tax=Marinobacterium litorale TaxID=404770 RepID=UPI00041EDA02|nr:GHMP kinase [Marinobacterium litorale]
MSESSILEASAPGSIMLMGEHAVLRGATALACAVDRYIHIRLAPRNDRQVNISSALGDYSATLEHLPDDVHLSFVVAALQSWREVLPGGFDLSIQSEFSHTLGLGSSAAVVAALTALLDRFAGTGLTREQQFDRALKVIHQVQNGRGSGTDLAASLYGGVIAYRVNPRQLRPLKGLPTLGLWYVGYKMKTPEVLALVERKSQRYPSLYEGLDRLMAQCSEKTAQAVDAEDWSATGELMNLYQGLMDALGVNDARLSELVYALRAQDGVWGAKISGSGLGDCVVCLGEAGDLDLPYERIAVGVSAPGVRITTVEAGD